MFGYPVKTIKHTAYPWNAISTRLVLCQYSTAALRFHLQNRFLEKLLFLASWNRVSQPRKYMVPICLFCPRVPFLYLTNPLTYLRNPCPISLPIVVCVIFWLLLCSFFYVTEIYEQGWRRPYFGKRIAFLTCDMS